MKIGHASYGFYGTVLDFVVVNGNIIILDNDGGYIGFTKTKEDALALVKEIYDCPEQDVSEVLDVALETENVTPYKKGEENG